MFFINILYNISNFKKKKNWCNLHTKFDLLNLFWQNNDNSFKNNLFSPYISKHP